MPIDNKARLVRNFYKLRPHLSMCFVCEDYPATMVIQDGHDTIICDMCSYKTLEECGFKDDFHDNRFNKQQPEG